jgi:HAD superfamily hydrolase (TIGR01509 family)
MKIKAILFDMDGVLIAAKDWHYDAFNKALNLFGFSISRHEHLAIYDGLPTKHKLEILSKERGLPSQLHSFLNELKQKFTMDIVHQRCRPLFIHEFALSKLKDRGYKIAVCSNSIRSTIDLMMEKSFLAGYLDLIVSNQDVKNSKPDPEMYLKAIEYFSLSPRECLIIEDSHQGIKAAKASGANLLIVDSVFDVNYTNISKKINEIDGLDVDS